MTTSITVATIRMSRNRKGRNEDREQENDNSTLGMVKHFMALIDAVAKEGNHVHVST